MINNNYVIGAFILGLLYQTILDLLTEPIRKKWRKECNYDCSKCKVWDCDKWYCLSQKKKNIKKQNKKRCNNEK